MFSIYFIAHVTVVVCQEQAGFDTSLHTKTMSKAVYNNPKVRLGNWSEDQFGAELAAQPRQQAKSKSVAQESYPRHSTQAYVNKATPSGTRDSGASFAEMFGHRGAASGADHFRTSDPISGGKRVSGAGRKRAKKINSESTVCTRPMNCIRLVNVIIDVLSLCCPNSRRTHPKRQSQKLSLTKQRLEPFERQERVLWPVVTRPTPVKLLSQSSSAARVNSLTQVLLHFALWQLHRKCV